jgi:hypothetical protein
LLNIDELELPDAAANQTAARQSKNKRKIFLIAGYMLPPPEALKPSPNAEKKLLRYQSTLTYLRCQYFQKLSKERN